MNGCAFKAPFRVETSKVSMDPSGEVYASSSVTDAANHCIAYFDDSNCPNGDHEAAARWLVARLDALAGVNDPQALVDSYKAMTTALDHVNNWKRDHPDAAFDPHEDMPSELYEEVLGALNTYVKV